MYTFREVGLKIFGEKKTLFSNLCDLKDTVNTLYAWQPFWVIKCPAEVGYIAIEAICWRYKQHHQYFFNYSKRWKMQIIAVIFEIMEIAFLDAWRDRKLSLVSPIFLFPCLCGRTWLPLSGGLRLLTSVRCAIWVREDGPSRSYLV